VQKDKEKGKAVLIAKERPLVKYSTTGEKYKLSDGKEI
jgi:hypothetical protein